LLSADERVDTPRLLDVLTGTGSERGQIDGLPHRHYPEPLLAIARQLAGPMTAIGSSGAA
jgi:hypothetical protein